MRKTTKLKIISIRNSEKKDKDYMLSFYDDKDESFYKLNQSKSIDLTKEELKFLGKEINQILSYLKKNELYNDLLIKKGEIIEMFGKKLQSVTARADAWICANCGRTPYVNHSETKQERDDDHDEPCPLASLTEEFDFDEYDSAPCSCDTIPLSLYSDNKEWEITLCMKCAKETGILEKMVG